MPAPFANARPLAAVVFANSKKTGEGKPGDTKNPVPTLAERAKKVKEKSPS